MKNLLKILIFLLFSVTVVNAQHEYDKFRYCNYILDFSQSEPVLDSNDLEFTDYFNGEIDPTFFSFFNDSSGNNLIYADENNVVIDNEFIWQDLTRVRANYFDKSSIIPTRDPNLFYVYNSVGALNGRNVKLIKVEISNTGYDLSSIDIPFKFINFEITHHYNGLDFWLVAYNFKTNQLESYLVDENFSFTNTSFKYQIPDQSKLGYFELGQYTISPNSKYIFGSSFNDNAPYYLLSFNNQTGSINILSKIDVNAFQNQHFGSIDNIMYRVNSDLPPDSYSKEIVEDLTIEENKFNIYPNPVDDILNVESFDKNIKIKEINIYQLDGKLLKSSLINNVDLHDFISGAYILEIVSDDGTFIKKLIKK